MEEEEQHKICFKCGVDKPLSEFYKHKEMLDGHLNKCKECAKKDTKENREKRDEFYKAYDRQRGKLEHRKRYNRERLRIPQNRERRKEVLSKWEQNNIDKKKAHSKVSHALRDGLLFKLPCFICGDTSDVEAHHEDYTKPLDVVWLCVKHHAELHRKYDHAQDEEFLENYVRGSRYDKEKTDEISN